MLTVPGSIPITRGMASSYVQSLPIPEVQIRSRFLTDLLTSWLQSDRPGDVGDRLGVEHEIVALEQAGDAGLVDLHLQAADAERAERRDARRAPRRRR